ncbi:hypothetical protein COB28_03440 [Candidatus Dependentiae bacterium]|nr:MAG: hypothetical protein COB28_03440 [Candidatus Dependentiae bacterium]
MSSLEKLEVVVRDLLSRYQETQREIIVLEESEKTLTETCSSLEAALLKESLRVTELLDEKESIKVTVDELLVSIEKVEEAQK